jgi:acyl dehydratase
MGSPGMDEVRWLRPVRPEDTLAVTGEVLELRPSRSRPDRGSARIAYSVNNQNGEPVMTFTVTHILARRPSG